MAANPTSSEFLIWELKTMGPQKRFYSLMDPPPMDYEEVTGPDIVERAGYREIGDMFNEIDQAGVRALDYYAMLYPNGESLEGGKEDEFDDGSYDMPIGYDWDIIDAQNYERAVLETVDEAKRNQVQPTDETSGVDGGPTDGGSEPEPTAASEPQV